MTFVRGSTLLFSGVVGFIAWKMRAYLGRRSVFSFGNVDMRETHRKIAQKTPIEVEFERDEEIQHFEVSPIGETLIFGTWGHKVIPCPKDDESNLEQITKEIWEFLKSVEEEISNFQLAKALSQSSRGYKYFQAIHMERWQRWGWERKKEMLKEHLDNYSLLCNLEKITEVAIAKSDKLKAFLEQKGYQTWGKILEYPESRKARVKVEFPQKEGGGEAWKTGMLEGVERDKLEIVYDRLFNTTRENLDDVEASNVRLVDQATFSRELGKLVTDTSYWGKKRTELRHKMVQSGEHSGDFVASLMKWALDERGWLRDPAIAGHPPIADETEPLDIKCTDKHDYSSIYFRLRDRIQQVHKFGLLKQLQGEEDENILKWKLEKHKSVVRKLLEDFLEQCILYVLPDGSKPEAASLDFISGLFNDEMELVAQETFTAKLRGFRHAIRDQVLSAKSAKREERQALEAKGQLGDRLAEMKEAREVELKKDQKRKELKTKEQAQKKDFEAWRKDVDDIFKKKESSASVKAHCLTAMAKEAADLKALKQHDRLGERLAEKKAAAALKKLTVEDVRGLMEWVGGVNGGNHSDDAFS